MRNVLGADAGGRRAGAEWSLVLAVIVVGMLVASGCSTTSPDEPVFQRVADLEWVDEPPFVSSGYLVGAAKGDTWVQHDRTIYQDNELASLDDDWFTARRADGKWAVLANPPVAYASVALATVGDDVVMAGVWCTTPYAGDPPSCPKGEVQWSRLSEDLRTWEPFAEPEPFSNDGEAVVTALPGMHDVGVFSTPSGGRAVDASGTVRTIPDPEAGSGPVDLPVARCIVDSTLAVSTMRYGEDDTTSPTAPDEFPARRRTFRIDLSAEQPEWVEAAPAPHLRLTSGVCLSTGILMVEDGIETIYDPVADTWAVGAEPVPELVGRGFQLTSQPKSVTTSDGTTFVSDLDWNVMRRAPDGVWTNTGVLNGSNLIATDSQAFVVSADPPGLTELPSS